MHENSSLCGFLQGEARDMGTAVCRAGTGADRTVLRFAGQSRQGQKWYCVRYKAFGHHKESISYEI